jgi:predicted site-specific integrase-resolvase
MPHSDHFISLKRAAALADRSAVTIWRWAKHGLIRVQNTPYGALYNAEDVLRRAKRTNRVATQPHHHEVAE